MHACVLVEDEANVALFDPGQFAWESGLVHIEAWPKLDYVLITHEHFDHFYEPFVTELIRRFPDARFMSTPEVCKKLTALGAQHVYPESDEQVTLVPLNHASMAPLAGNPPCQNVRINYKNITHPGDSITFSDSRPILFLPLAGPWEAAVDAVATGEQSGAEIIIPIHDWMWNDQWRATMYDRLEQFYTGKNIRFLKPVNGQALTVEL